MIKHYIEQKQTGKQKKMKKNEVVSMEVFSLTSKQIIEMSRKMYLIGEEHFLEDVNETNFFISSIKFGVYVLYKVDSDTSTINIFIPDEVIGIFKQDTDEPIYNYGILAHHILRIIGRTDCRHIKYYGCLNLDKDSIDFLSKNTEIQENYKLYQYLSMYGYGAKHFDIGEPTTDMKMPTYKHFNGENK